MKMMRTLYPVLLPFVAGCTSALAGATADATIVQDVIEADPNVGRYGGRQDGDATEPVFETATGTFAELKVQDVTVRALLPCVEPRVSPPRDGVLQNHTCLVGNQIYVLAGSQGERTPAQGPLRSDFETAYAEIESSEDTITIERGEMGAYRTLYATRGPDPAYGLVRAVEVAPETMVYAVAMSKPGTAQLLSHTDKQDMRDFVRSLEITP